MEKREFIEMTIMENGLAADIWSAPVKDAPDADLSSDLGKRLVEYYRENHPDDIAFAKETAGRISRMTQAELGAGISFGMPGSVDFRICRVGHERLKADLDELAGRVRERDREKRKPRYAEAVFTGALCLPFRTAKRRAAICELPGVTGRWTGLLVVDGVNGIVAPFPQGVAATRVWYDTEFRSNQFFEEQSLILKSAMRFHLELSMNAEPECSAEDVEREILLSRPVYDNPEFSLTFGNKLDEYREDLSVVRKNNGVERNADLPLSVLREISGGFRAALSPVVDECAQNLREDSFQALLPMIEWMEEKERRRHSPAAPRP